MSTTQSNSFASVNRPNGLFSCQKRAPRRAAPLRGPRSLALRATPQRHAKRPHSYPLTTPMYIADRLPRSRFAVTSSAVTFVASLTHLLRSCLILTRIPLTIQACGVGAPSCLRPFGLLVLVYLAISPVVNPSTYAHSSATPGSTPPWQPARRLARRHCTQHPPALLAERHHACPLAVARGIHPRTSRI